LTILLAGCSSWGERPWLKAPDWGRAKLLGNTFIGDPTPLAVDDAGNVYLFLVDMQEEEFHPRVIALDERGEALWSRSYAPILILPDQPKIYWDGRGLQLFWLSDQSLYQMGVDPSGEMISDVRLLSENLKVGYYDAAVGPGGALSVWYSGPRQAPGLYALSPVGRTPQAFLMDPTGVRPDIQFDADTLHAVWAHYPLGYGSKRLLFASYPNGDLLPEQEVVVAEPIVGISSIMQGPALGLDDELAYVLWTVQVQTGLEAGFVETEYIQFEKDMASEPARPRELAVPREHQLHHQDPTGGEIRAGQRVSLNGERMPLTLQVADLVFNNSQADELVAAFKAKTDYLRRKAQWQISTVFFADGVPSDYQLLSFTPASSRTPQIMSDREGYLYLTWLEKGDEAGFAVFFATTAPDFREQFDVVTGVDVSQLFAETSFGLASGVILIPLGLVWIMAAAVVMGLSSWLRKENEPLLSPGTLISLGLALAAYWSAKLFILPGMVDYVPFSAWIPLIPEWMRLPLRIGVPALITLVAARVTFRYTFGGEERSLLFLVLIYGAIDSLLTLAIYGVLFFEAF
jgi:hypothetical protein